MMRTHLRLPAIFVALFSIAGCDSGGGTALPDGGPDAPPNGETGRMIGCLLYTSDAADA